MLIVNNGSASYDATYFESFAVEHIPKDVEKFIGNKNIIADIYRIQASNLIWCGNFCIGFTDCLKVKVYQIIQIYFLLANMNTMIN